jgi:peptide-methionine (S)-S-oxide reductase
MNTATAILGNGCFWCTEAVFSRLKGVLKVTSGYSGGNLDNPGYESVCSGETGHAECLEIIYDQDILSFEHLLEVFFKTHDPTTLNRQGNDVGTQYRSVIFYKDEKEKNEAAAFIENLEKEKRFESPIVTTLEPYQKFYPAEDYHRQYFDLHGTAPYCHFVVRPKVEKFIKEFRDKLK